MRMRRGAADTIVPDSTDPSEDTMTHVDTMTHLSAWSAARVAQPVNPGLPHVLLWFALHPHAAARVVRSRTARSR